MSGLPAVTNDARAHRRCPQLDGLRAVAVMAVLLLHAYGNPLPGGFIGVDIFFVLSGFLITGVLVGELQAAGSVSLRRFYLRRALRLYPALLFLLVAFSPLGPGLAGSWGAWAREAGIAGSYTADLVPYLPNGDHLFSSWLLVLTPMWTLAVEEQFYLLWPLCLLAALRCARTLSGVSIVATVAGALLVFPLPLVTGGTFYYRADFRFGDLLIGCALSLLLTRYPLRTNGRWAQVLRFATPVAVALIIVARAELADLEQDAGFAAWSLILALSAAVVVARLATSESALVSRVLKSGPLPRIGRWSYSLYLWNYPLITILEPRLIRRGASGLLIVIIEFAAFFAAAAASYRLVEIPFLRLKSRLRSTPVAGLPDHPSARLFSPSPSRSSQMPGMHSGSTRGREPTD